MSISNETSTYGSTYKQIRQGKKLSQETVTKDKISRSSLSKFEHNKQTIYLDNFLNLLDEVNLEINEFMYIDNNYQHKTKNTLKNKFYSTYPTADKDTYKKLNKDIETFLDKNDDWYLKMIKKYIDIISNDDDDTIAQQDRKMEKLATDIWEELQKTTHWFKNDLQLLNVILYYLPASIYEEAIERLLKRLKTYTDSNTTNVLLPSFQLNASLAYIEHGELNKAQELTDLALQTVKENCRYDIYVVGLVRKGTITKNFDMVYKGLKIAETLDDLKLTQLMNIEVVKNIPAYFSKCEIALEDINWENGETREAIYNFSSFYWFPI